MDLVTIAVLYILLSIVAAMLLFELRRWRPFAYGVFEFAIGLIGLTLTFYPQTTYLLTGEATPWGLTLSRGITIVGGIYLLVRGMDNMDRDLPRRWRPHWEALFPKRDERIGR